jgi:hypothetical protein
MTDATLAPDFRPDSYWDVSDPVVAITASIRGELRRHLVRDLLTGEAVRNSAVGWQLEGLDLDPELMADVVSEEDLERRRAIHAWFRGGEHLPRLLPGEAEIARVVVWKGDLLVVSFRARRDADATLRYRVVDEVGTRYCGFPRTSAAPLTALELVRAIDGLRVFGWRIASDDFVLTLRNLHMMSPECEDDIWRAADLVTVSSAFYPDLDSLYERRARDWADFRIGAVQERMEQGNAGEAADPLMAYVLERLDGC